MIRNDDQEAARNESVTQFGERFLQYTKLVVDSDANSLKQPGEISGSRARAKGATDRVDEIITYAHRFSPAATHNLTREPASTWLVTVVAKKLG